MADDIVARLRNPPWGTETSERMLMKAAADEIERLRSLCGDLKRARDETSKNADFLRETMRAEIERLREALDVIASNNGLALSWLSTAPMPMERYKENCEKMMHIARAALAPKA